VIILDTNIVSETQKANPDPAVMAWLDQLDPGTTYLTAITVAELLFGVDIMPMGERRAKLEGSVTALVDKTFHGRILPFDATAAHCFAALVASARRDGKAVSFPDGAIAAIARSNNYATVATRDASPFLAMRIDVIDPWKGRG